MPIADATTSSRLSHLAQLVHARLGVLKLLPADGHHVVASLARGHDDAKLVRCRREVVVGLITEGDLLQNLLALLFFVVVPS